MGVFERDPKHDPNIERWLSIGLIVLGVAIACALTYALSLRGGG